MFSSLIRKVAKFGWFLPGFLLWAAFPPVCEGADALFALAPLIWLSRRAHPSDSAKRWFMSGIFYWVATLSWMPAIVKNGGPWPLVVLGWFALAAYCSAYFAAYGWLSSRYWTWARASGSYGLRILGILLVEPVLWCGLELVRSRLFGGFSWNQLGVVPANLGFGSPAALGGVYLLSAVVLLINGTIAGIAERVWRPERSGFAALRRWGAVETVGVFAVIWGIYAAARTAAAPESDAATKGTVKVALVQRNFPCVFKGRDEERPLEVYARLLENVADLKPDLVVLAESALCEFGPVDQQGAQSLASLVREKTGASLLAGGTRYDDGDMYNSAALFTGGDGLQVYDKVHLVPFGEFIPGDKWIPVLKKLAPVGSCTPGTPRLLSLSVADAETVPVGVSICFEDTDSANVRRQAKMGARLLAFITNDSWFSRSDEALAHSWQATARAIETGLPVVRVGNSGVTGTISPAGRASWLVGSDGKPLVDRRGTMFDRVSAPSRPSPTPYVRLGDIPLSIAFALAIAGMILVHYRNNYEKRRKLSM